MALRKHLKKVEVEDKCKSSKDVFIQALYVHRTLRRQAGMCRGYWKKLQQLHATVYGSSLLVISQSQLRCLMLLEVQISKSA